MPGEGFVLQDNREKPRGLRRIVSVNQKRRDTGHFISFECVAENEGEKGRQNQQQNQDATIAVNMEKLLVSHASDGA